MFASRISSARTPSCRFISNTTMPAAEINGVMATRVVKVQNGDLGHFTPQSLAREGSTIDIWELPVGQSSSMKTLHKAGTYLRTSNIPVAFPTETVYGLGADATRSDAVKGIYKAKGRPSDNPLIIHVCDLTMLRSLLLPDQQLLTSNGYQDSDDPIPSIYEPLITKFWPGPLTILLPNPPGSKLAPEVTAGLKTFGARMPHSPLALTLIKCAGVPIAAPSANASTKPSPTTAAHVFHDLNGKIELILDGGPCDVGVESTVVDGLCDPPVVLRPGGLSIDEIRACHGWEDVVKGYKDKSEIGDGTVPRAPGMKYKHYSPKAKVVLYEKGTKPKYCHFSGSSLKNIGGEENGKSSLKLGIVRTKGWPAWAGWDVSCSNESDPAAITKTKSETDTNDDITVHQGYVRYQDQEHPPDGPTPPAVEVFEISLGKDTRDIAHGLFSALRELDRRGVQVILVEGIEDADGKGSEGGEKSGADIAAAVMNRLRKAAGEIVYGE